MFYAALQGGHPELLIIGILASILGIYYYLRPIAMMFMTQREEAPQAEIAPALAGVPASPRPATALASQRSAGAGTALAVKTPASKTATATLAVESAAAKPASEKQQLRGFTWLALFIATVGTLVVGVILPIWLPNLQQAAQTLLK